MQPIQLILYRVVPNHALNALLDPSAQSKVLQLLFHVELDTSQPQEHNLASCASLANYVTLQLFHKQLKKRQPAPVFTA